MEWTINILFLFLNFHALSIACSGSQDKASTEDNQKKEESVDGLRVQFEDYDPGKILAGVPVQPLKHRLFRFIVRIHAFKKEQRPDATVFRVCGGAMLTSTCAVTAAKCGYDLKSALPYALHQVHIGDFKPFQYEYGEVTVNCRYFLVHKLYDQNNWNAGNDIAMCVFNSTVIMDWRGAHVPPKNYWWDGKMKGKKVALFLAAGWGSENRPENAGYGDLKYIRVIPHSFAYCLKNFPETYDMYEYRGTACCNKITQNGKIEPGDICYHDMGGPVFAVDAKTNSIVLIGIINEYTGDCGALTNYDEPIQMTDVRFFRRFIWHIQNALNDQMFPEGDLQATVQQYHKEYSLVSEDVNYNLGPGLKRSP